MKKICSLWAAFIVIAALATACGGSSGTSQTTEAATSSAAASESPAAAGATITIEGMAFSEPLTVAPGAEINIVNKDTVEHSVTSDTSGVFSQDVDGGENKTLTAPSQPGTYQFHCKYHPNMKGTLIVK